MRQVPLLALRVATTIAGIVAIAENYSLVAFQITTYQSCEGFPRYCGVILPYTEYDYILIAGVALLVFSLLASKVIRFVRNHAFYVGLGLLLVGIPLLAEGSVVFADSDGGAVDCYGGAACWRMFYLINVQYWTGIALTILSLGAVSIGASLLLLLRVDRLDGPTTRGSPNLSLGRWRLSLVCSISVLLVSIFTLVPFVPVQINSYSQQIDGANLSCDQIEPSVFPYPIFVYNASASPSLALLGAGNAIYSHCIVTSPANRSLPGPPSSCPGSVVVIETQSLTCLRIT